jgi:hypothetical protein
MPTWPHVQAILSIMGTDLRRRRRERHHRAPVKKKGRAEVAPLFEYLSADENANADEQQQHEDEEQGHDHDAGLPCSASVTKSPR